MKSRFSCLSLLILGMVMSVNAQTPEPSNSQQDFQRFDTDGDGTLSVEEKEVMIGAIATEAFTGQRLAVQAPRASQPGRRFGGGPGFGGRRGPRQREELIDRFDADGNGKLNREEREAARQYIQDSREEVAPARPSGRTSPKTTPEADLQTSLAAAPQGNPALYDEKTLRTLYLRFHDEDWYEQLGDFYRTDVDVPANLTVDGKVYPSIGVRFRGSSSYFTIQHSEKKSLNLAIDYGEEGQRLYGYKTLNLLNGHADPSFLREVLYSRIAREFTPAPKANFVKLVVNGEDWGVYINSQQFNKDFLEEWFGTKKGVRWKVPPGRNSGLLYSGDEPADYQLKTKAAEAPNAWQDLIQLCKILDQTPDDRLEADLSPVFNIDGALWFLALENVFIDNDGYISRASDYAIYQDPTGRFHLLSHDSNETFRFAGGGGPNSWESDGSMLSPLAQAHDEMRPVIRRLLAIPHLRARYLAHIRTVVDEWLDWDVLNPIIEEYQLLIDAAVKADDKKLYAYEAFASSRITDVESRESPGPPSGLGGGRARRGGRGSRVTPSFKRFISERCEYLLNHDCIDRPTPRIQSVSQPNSLPHTVHPDPIGMGLRAVQLADQPVQVTAELGGDVAVEAIILYYAADRLSPFKRVPMSKNGNLYVGEIPAFPAGKKVRYYVEARAGESHNTTTFSPAKAELGALAYRVVAPNPR